ncbi:MAG: alkaline phosphatase family protein, partial [Planctomycetaceae bacterium]|nr:alkaline phosphatase family protein [Planctomycetaceae bacterium]
YRFFVLSLFVSIFTVTSVNAERVPKSLVIMLDGARSDVMLMAKTPNFDSVCNGSWATGYHGAWSLTAHTVKDAPTISGPNHATIATGATPQKTNVPNNDLYENYNKTNASATYKNHLTRIKEKYPEKKTAFVFSWKPDKILVSENNPCDLVVCDSDQNNAKYVPKILDGSYESEHWKKGTDIDAMLYFIDLPDHVGHSGGYCPPGQKHKEYIACIEEIDSWFGVILETIRKRTNFANEDWLIVITSDHGGWINGHGPMRADNFTIPFFVTGQNIVSGEMEGQPCNADAAVTVLNHFGFDVAKMKESGLIDGSVRGTSKTILVTNKPIEDGLLVYLPFDGNFENKASNGTEPISAENHGAKLESTGGKRNGYLSIRKSDSLQYVTLGNPKPLQWGTDKNFSIAFWTRFLSVQEGDPVIIGNKDWKNGRLPGFSFFVNPLNANNGNIIGFNLADHTSLRVDVKQIFLTPNEWWFCAVTVNRQGNVILFAGSPDGRLFWVSESLIDENLGKRFGVLKGNIDTPLSWNIGQDGTGTYQSQLNADIDELRIWNRALSLKEIETLFKNAP